MLTGNAAYSSVEPPRHTAIDAEQQRLIQAAQRKIVSDANEHGPTTQLGDRKFSNISVESWMPRERVSRRYSPYRVAPHHLALSEATANQPRWRVELHGNEPVTDPIIRLDIVGDVVLGRCADADIDLSAYNAEQLGVSRRHALLRPTDNHLYLIDLNSTNGTLHNATPVTSGVARPLDNNDVITLGKLIFTVRIIGLVKRDEKAPGGMEHLSGDQVSGELLPILPLIGGSAGVGTPEITEPAPADPTPRQPERRTLPMPAAKRPDHSRLPDHIRRAAGETTETQRMIDPLGGLRRWLQHKNENNQDETPRPADAPPKR